jgi:hypothetical protein
MAPMVKTLPQVVQSVTRAAGRPSKNTFGDPESMAVPPQRGQFTVSVLRAAGLPDIFDFHINIQRQHHADALYRKQSDVSQSTRPRK